MPGNRGLVKAASQTFERSGSQVRLLTRSVSGVLQRVPRLVRNASQTFQEHSQAVSQDSVLNDLDTLLSSIEKSKMSLNNHETLTSFLLVIHFRIESLGDDVSANDDVTLDALIIQFGETLQSMIELRAVDRGSSRDIIKKLMIFSDNLDLLLKQPSFAVENSEAYSKCTG